MRRKDCASPSPLGRRWPEGPDEGRSLTLTRRFAAPSPRGRGTLRKIGFHFENACKPCSAWISGDSPKVIWTGLPLRRGGHADLTLERYLKNRLRPNLR